MSNVRWAVWYGFCSKFHAISSSAKKWKSVKIWRSYRDFNGGNFFWYTVYIPYHNPVHCFAVWQTLINEHDDDDDDKMDYFDQFDRSRSDLLDDIAKWSIADQFHLLWFYYSWIRSNYRRSWRAQRDGCTTSLTCDWKVVSPFSTYALLRIDLGQFVNMSINRAFDFAKLRHRR